MARQQIGARKDLGEQESQLLRCTVKRLSRKNSLIPFLACLFGSSGRVMAFNPLRFRLLPRRNTRPNIVTSSIRGKTPPTQTPGRVQTIAIPCSSIFGCTISPICTTPTSSSLFSTSASSSSPSSASASASASAFPKQKTQYTIDDSVCLPTKPETLEKAVHKACRSLDVYMERKPIAAHTKRAFEVLVEIMGEEPKSGNYDGIVLDSGCGTGRSTKLLASSIHPRHVVIGVDRSFARLTKTKDNRQDRDDNNDDANNDSNKNREAYCHKVSENAYLVRAELVDFWRCCIKQGWTSSNHDSNLTGPSGNGLKITHHYMLYPNPYPTKARLSSRWYAHPSFPLILKLGVPSMVVRSNWEGYLSEFAKAIEMADAFYADEDKNTSGSDNLATPYISSARRGPMERIDKSIALTNFESKYDTVGESTYELSLEHER